MKKERIFISTLIITALVILAGCGTKDMSITPDTLSMVQPIESSNQSNEIVTPTVTDIPIPTPTVTPAPTETPTPTPVITPVPLYQQVNSPGAYPIPAYYDDAYVQFTDYEKWLVSDEGIRARITYASKYFSISEDDATYIMAAYYDWVTESFNPMDYDYDFECQRINKWITSLIDGGYISADNSIQDIIDVYKLDEYILMDDWFGLRYEDIVSLYVDDESYDDSSNTLMNDQAISNNGETLQFGDKVKYEAIGIEYYGGTVYEIRGTQVKVKWEVKGDMFVFPDEELTDDYKLSCSMLNLYGTPSDTEYIEASQLEKLSYLSW